MARGHSGMFDSGDTADGFDEVAPSVALRFEHLRARWCQTVVAAAPLARLLDPAALDPAAFLEAVQQWVQGGDAERQQPTRSRFDQFAQVVAVARLILDQRENQELRAPFLQLAVEDRRLHILHSDILAKGI